jgi:hypothetical protein
MKLRWMDILLPTGIGVIFFGLGFWWGVLPGQGDSIGHFKVALLLGVLCLYTWVAQRIDESLHPEQYR